MSPPASALALRVLPPLVDQIVTPLQIRITNPNPWHVSVVSQGGEPIQGVRPQIPPVNETREWGNRRKWVEDWGKNEAGDRYASRLKAVG